MIAVEVLVALAPVFIFLLSLVAADSYKLVSLRAVLTCIAAGFAAAGLSYQVTRVVLDYSWAGLTMHSRYGAPVLEELLKALFLFYLIKSRRVGFMVDAAIAGFAIGAGFASVENLYFLYVIERSDLVIWFIRGFGTAIMHGATAAIMGIVTKSLADRRVPEKWYVFLPGLLIAIVIHSIYNHFILPPALSTLLLMVTLPVLLFVVFDRSEKSLKSWLELDLDSDISLLQMIRSGRILGSKTGQYLMSLKGHFPGEVLADMLCYVRLHVELAIRAKGFLMMREAGFAGNPGPEIRERFTELRYLEKSIGATGKLALAPLLRTSSRDLWQMQLLLDL